MKKLSVSLTPSEEFWGWIWLAVQLIALPTMLKSCNFLLGNALSPAQINIIFFCINFIAVTVIFRKFLLGNGASALSLPWKCLRYAAIGLVFHWISSYLYSIFLLLVYPEYFNANDLSISAILQENYSLVSFGVVLLVPVAEETLYRGLIFGSLYNRNPLAAYIVSVVAFAALHIVGYIGQYPFTQLLFSFLQYIPAGFSLAWAYAKTDSIWAPILMHIAINQVGILSMR